MRGIAGRQRELIGELPILLCRHLAHDAQIPQNLPLQRAPDLGPVLGGASRDHHSHRLLLREHLRPVQQLLELRQPETLPYTIRVVGPQEIANPLGHF